MGAEVPATLGRRAAIIAACAALALLGAAGCGSDDDEQPNASETATLGPTSAEGDVESSPATLRSEDGYSTLATAQVTTRGNQDTLIAGQVELTGSSEPDFRLNVDGKKSPGTQVDVTESGGTRTALVSCACKFPTGEHEVIFEAAAKGSTAKIGARVLVVFDEVQLDDAGASPIIGSVLETDETQVISEGATLAQTSTSGGEVGGPLLVIASVAAPRTGTGSENVRLEVEIGGDTTSEVAKTTIPSGKLSAYLDNKGSGEDVIMRGYTTAGRTSVGVASLIACSCGLAR